MALENERVFCWWRWQGMCSRYLLCIALWLKWNGTRKSERRIVESSLTRGSGPDVAELSSYFPDIWIFKQIFSSSQTHKARGKLDGTFIRLLFQSVTIKRKVFIIIKKIRTETWQIKTHPPTYIIQHKISISLMNVPATASILIKLFISASSSVSQCLNVIILHLLETPKQVCDVGECKHVA